MENPKPTLLYFFAHVFLRDAVFQQWETLRTSIHKGPSIFQDNLRANFLRLSNEKNNFRNTNIELFEDDFKPLAVNLASGEKRVRIFIVRFPKPKESPEVAYIAITDELKPKYFTLELSRPTLSQKNSLPVHMHSDNFIFCEWTSEGNHNNYGAVTSPILENFINRIDKALKA